MITPDLETVLRCADADLEGLVGDTDAPADQTRKEIHALLDAKPWEADLATEREKVRVLRSVLEESFDFEGTDEELFNGFADALAATEDKA